jgi:hypothetical protein
MARVIHEGPKARQSKRLLQSHDLDDRPPHPGHEERLGKIAHIFLKRGRGVTERVRSIVAKRIFIFPLERDIRDE